MEYRNIGSLGDSTGILIPVESNKNGQVYLATHDGEGSALSKTQRSYISFSWGARDIEEFDLLVVNDGSSYQGQMYAQFQDLTTEYDLLDGQHYWGFHFSPNELVFSLATDGVMEATLQEFRNWFRPGIERELILAEHPYRAIKARVAEVPTYSLLPFEEKVNKIFNGVSYTTSTTKWRGQISLHFIMDDPQWYSIADGAFEFSQINNEDQEENIKQKEHENENKLKTMFEDGVPFVSMFKTTTLLTDGKMIKMENNVPTLIRQENLTLTANEPVNLYYCGTAKESPKLTFSFHINQFDENDYFNGIGNTYAETDYGKIQIGTKEFLYTAPSVLMAYNQAVSILSNDFSVGDSIYELKSAFRDLLGNFYTRSWATGICELALREGNGLNICDSAGALTSDYKDNFITCLKQLFDLQETSKGYCTFDSSTGFASFAININILDLYALDEASEITPTNLPIKKDTVAEEIEGETVESEVNALVLIEENSGDMLRSEYLTIEDRVLPNENNEITDNECLKVISNYDLEDFLIIYQYKYL